MNKVDAYWSEPVTVEEIPDEGLHREIVAAPETRAALAARAGLREVAHAAARFDLARRGSGVRVTGQVSARVGQTCVVTLEPIDNDIEEPVDLLFMPEFAGEGPGLADTLETEVTQGEDPPEPLVGGRVDLGAIAAEFVMLGVDPYPRKPGAEFSPPRAAADTDAHPFAALATLKPRSDRDRS